MDVKELLKSLIETEPSEPEIDESEGEQLELDSANVDTTDAGDSQNVNSSEDTNAADVEALGQIAEALANRDKATNARIDSIEKKLTQLLNKGAASTGQEQSASEPEARQTLAEMDFVTPAPKV